MHKIYNLVNNNKKHPIDQEGLYQYDSIETLPEPLKNITKNYLKSLNITESIGRNITIEEMNEIERFLEEIGLLRKVKLKTYSIMCNKAGAKYIDSVRSSDQLILMQPGMQYCIAQALVEAVKKEKKEFITAVNSYRRANYNNPKSFTKEGFNNIMDNILDDIRGKILENLVLVEVTAAAEKIAGSDISVNKTVIKLLDYVIGDKGSTDIEACTNKEVDFAVLDDRDKLSIGTYRLFEIKHSDSIKEKQSDNLRDPDVKWALESCCNDLIVQRTVLYRGPSKVLYNGVIYYNVEDFLCKLGEDPNFLVCDLKEEIEKEQREVEQTGQEAAKIELVTVLEPKQIEDTNIAPNKDVYWCER